MDPAMILAMISFGRKLITEGVALAEAAKAKKDITDEQFNEIKERAETTDKEWDSVAAAAKKRLESK